MKTIEFKLPKVISECIIEEVDSSLNTFFPKLFYEVNIGEKLMKIVIPPGQMILLKTFQG